MKKIILTVCSFLLVFTTSCRDEELDRLAVKEIITDTAILKTLDKSTPSLNVNKLEGKFSITVEYNDFKDNNTLKSVDYYVKYTDNKPNSSGKLLKKAEAKLGTINADAFTPSENGKIKATINFTDKDVINALGVNANDVDHGNVLIFRLAANTNSGKVFSSDNVAGSITNTSAFQSPFRYSTKLKKLNTAVFTVNSDYSLKSNSVVTSNPEIAFDESNLKIEQKGSNIQFVKVVFKDKRRSASNKNRLYFAQPYVPEAKSIFEKGTPNTSVTLKKGDLYIYKITRAGKDYYGIIKAITVENGDSKKLAFEYREEAI